MPGLAVEHRTGDLTAFLRQNSDLHRAGHRTAGAVTPAMRMRPVPFHGLPPPLRRDRSEHLVTGHSSTP